MCGIFAYSGEPTNASQLILKGLKNLEYRGYDSWGIAVKKGNSIYLEKHVGKISNAQIKKVVSKVGIGHTRWATHGGITIKNAHPHLDCTQKIAVVHNGIVENFEEIKKRLIKQKHRFVSETDTEVIAHMIEDKIRSGKSIENATYLTFKELRGLNAIIVFYPEKNTFLAIKNSSPLIIGKGKRGFFIASDITAIIEHVNQVYYLKDNELVVIKDKDAYLLEVKKHKKIKIKFTKPQISVDDVGLGKYPNYMIKEINEQPKVIFNIAKNYKQNIKKIANKIRKSYGTYFIGCGTAYFAGLSGTYLFSKIAKRHVNSAVGSEFVYLIDFIKKESLVLALSQSGETIDIISSIKKVKEKGAYVTAITNVAGSTLYRMADDKLLLNAGPEKCVLATKSFTAKIAVLYLIAHTLNGSYDKAVENLIKVTKEIKKIIKNKKIKKIAQKIVNKRHIYILGRGVSYPTALESALKIKEVSYIHAEGFPAGELKHGVIALINKGTPVIVYNPTDETYDDTLSSAHEVKSRGAYVIGIGSKPNKIYDEFIHVDDCKNANIIPNVVIAQLLGYYLAIEKGLDPDKPRNLAKSVTVK